MSGSKTWSWSGSNLGSGYGGQDGVGVEGQVEVTCGRGSRVSVPGSWLGYGSGVGCRGSGSGCEDHGRGAWAGAVKG